MLDRWFLWCKRVLSKVAESRNIFRKIPKAKKPDIELINVGFSKFAEQQRLEIKYKVINKGDDTIKLTKTAIGWNLSSPDLLRDWHTYRKQKTSKKHKTTLQAGDYEWMRMIGDVLTPFQINMMRLRQLNLFMFGDVYFEVIDREEKFKHSYVIIIRLDKTFEYIEKDTIRL